MTFSKQRKVYQDGLSELRKVWKDEFEVIEEKKIQIKTAEKDRIILEKAVRLREKRKDSEIRQLQVKAARANALQLYKEHLARNLIVHRQRLDIQQKRYQKLTDDIMHEKNTWITNQNMDKKINKELFKKQSTTGIITNNSEHWRWHTVTLNVDRMMSPEYVSINSTNSKLADRFNEKNQSRLSKKMLVQDFLEPMISTGEQRAKFKELVSQFTSVFDETGAMTDHDLYFEQVADELHGYSDNDDYNRSRNYHDNDDDQLVSSEEDEELRK